MVLRNPNNHTSHDKRQKHTKKSSEWIQEAWRRIPENKGGHPKFHTAPIRITTVTVVIIIILYIVLLSEMSSNLKFADWSPADRTE